MIWAHINAVAEVARLRENPEFWQIRLQDLFNNALALLLNNLFQKWRY